MKLSAAGSLIIPPPTKSESLVLCSNVPKVDFSI